MSKSEAYSPINHRSAEYSDYARSIRFPDSKQRRINTIKFLWTLRGHVNPETGQKYTIDDMAKIFGCTRKSFNNALVDAGIVRCPTPEVRSGKIPENEMAFFMGLNHGNFESRELVWGSKKLMAVETATKKESRRNALKASLGTWGEIHEGKGSMSIYLDPVNFSFLHVSQNTTQIPEKVETFAPFLLGVLSMKMSEKEGRVSSQNGDLIQGISSQYINHFGENLGHYFQEQRDDTAGPTYTVELRDGLRVMSNLLQVPSVRALPFLPGLFGNNSQNGHS